MNSRATDNSKITEATVFKTNVTLLYNLNVWVKWLRKCLEILWKDHISFYEPFYLPNLQRKGLKNIFYKKTEQVLRKRVYIKLDMVSKTF